MEKSPDHNQILILKLTEIVLANLGNDKFGVSELARESRISRSWLNRKVFLATGKTAHQFIQKIRLNKAMEILQNEDVTASEVAYRTGFGSPAYFNTCFHEFFGYPPGEVKKRKGNTPDPNILTESISKSKLNRHKWRAYIITLSGILFLGTLIVTITLLVFHSPKSEKSIAVLPFINDSPSDSNQYFINGFMEDVLNHLQTIKDLHPISRTSAEKYRKTTKSIPEIAKELSVNYIVEGDMQRYGNNIRLSVNLFKALKRELKLWGKTYEKR